MVRFDGRDGKPIVMARFAGDCPPWARRTSPLPVQFRGQASLFRGLGAKTVTGANSRAERER
jgi:hypothetical protein